MDAAEEPSKPTPTAAPPLLSVGPVNQENNKGKSIDSVATLSTVLVEPTYLQKNSNATFSDADIKNFVELAQSLSPDFRIVHCSGVPLVVQCHNSREKIVLPSSGGFRALALEECYGSSLAGTLAPIKHLNCCVNIYGGQKYAPLWHNFANNVVHVHL